MKYGEQKSYPAYTGNRDLIHFIGGLDWQSNDIHAMPVDRKHSASFISFLDWLCRDVYPDEAMILVLDNVSYHRSASVMAMFALLEPRVQLIWLPKYSPDMNPIERFWLHLKNQVYANRLFPSLERLTEHIQLWLQVQNQVNHPDKLFFAKSL